ncbi:MAG: DMT family transporter [Acidiferrobacterales bacterium]
MSQFAAKHPRLAAAGALVLLSLIWGYNWVVMKLALRYASPFDFATMRTVLAAACLFIILAVLRRPLRPTAPLGLVCLGLLQTTGFIGFTMWALVNGDVGRTAVLVYTMPFWVVVLARISLGERTDGMHRLSVILGVAGLTMVLAPWRSHAGLGSDLLAISAGIFWAAGTLYAKMLRGRVHFDLLSLTAWQMLFGAIGLAIIALLLPHAPVHWNREFIGALAYNVILGNALAWFLWMYALDKLPAGVASLGTLATPAIGVLAAALQLGEMPDTAETAGMLLIGSALTLISLHAIRQHRRVSPEIGQE